MFDTTSIINCYITCIHFLYPLTKESFFTNNHNGRNYGGNGEIAIVDDDGNTIEIIIMKMKEESGGECGDC